MVNPVQTLRTASGVGIETARSTLQPCSLSNVFKTTSNQGHSSNILSQVSPSFFICYLILHYKNYNIYTIIILMIIPKT